MGCCGSKDAVDVASAGEGGGRGGGGGGGGGGGRAYAAVGSSGRATAVTQNVNRNAAAREAAWKSTGIIGLRDANLRELPAKIFAV